MVSIILGENTTMPNDIIYILKDNITTTELKYSLRSVEENFPHRYVFFVGGQPKGLKPDIAIKHQQTGDSKWAMIKSSMWKAVNCSELSDDFFLFNDDFFVMKPALGSFVNYADRTLSDRIEEFKQENPWLNPYARTLLKAKEELKTLGCPEVNYDVHMPMLFNKKLVKETINQCSSPQFRSVYGNINRIPFIQHKDVKVYDMETIPKNPDYLSTNDEVYRHGKVGMYIRATFTTPSRFEVTEE